MTAREGLTFEHAITSDCASLQPVISALLRQFAKEIHCLRDLTRGGLATACIELAEAAKKNFLLEQSKIPVEPTVHAACEILGLDPLYCANEGRFVLIVPAKLTADILALLHKFELTKQAIIVGRVSASNPGEAGQVLLQTMLKFRSALRRGTPFNLASQLCQSVGFICCATLMTTLRKASNHCERNQFDKLMSFTRSLSVLQIQTAILRSGAQLCLTSSRSSAYAPQTTWLQV